MQINHDFRAQLHDLRLELNAAFAIISDIVGSRYTIIQLDSEFDVMSEQDVFVTEDTYCNDVVNTVATITHNHVAQIEAMLLHPVYTALQLEAYIGTPLMHHGKVVGTLNFSSYDPQTPAYSQAQIGKVEALAREIEKAIV